MKTLTIAAMIAALLAVPAYAQRSTGGRQPAPEQPNDSAKKKADDKLYNDTLSRIPAKEYDPWQGVREKTPAPPAKTGR